ncbi:PepSY domain-containing protein [Psychrobacter fulvigenes]|uniref:PepSY domain-containing protein n=1 Tax=Psychrobacter fulvigenes TaxID=533323 RepID=UPI00191A3FF8|nr:PepSY domain-containing protein [Psychrobacter fulvigenes]
MKNLSTFGKSMVMALGIAGLGTASMMTVQASTKSQGSEAMAAVQSKVSFEQALNIAQKTVKGDIVSAEFDQNDYSAGGKYEVKVIANNTEYEIDIDADSGKVLKTKQEKLDNKDIAEYKAMKQAKVNLNQAMQTAARSVGGTVFEAEFDNDDGQSVYEIKVAKGNQTHKVMIDAMTGKVISTRLDNDD